MKPAVLQVRREPPYLRHDAGHRYYWETGENHALTLEQEETLSAWAQAAAGHIGPEDHGAVVRAVSRFVHDSMPQGDIEGNAAPPRPLGWIIDTGVGGGGLRRPPDTSGNEGSPGWVCINAAQLAAGLLRHLGYPVRECNVLLAQNGSYEHGFLGSLYQEAALQVWFDGGWHWADPYLLIFDPAATRDDRSRYKVDQPCYWAGTSSPTTWLPGHAGDHWVPFGLLEPLGSDLQRRFHPRLMDDGGRELPAAPRARVRRLSSVVDRRGGTATSGVFIRTRTGGVTLSLEDAWGRKLDAFHDEIPGAVHIARGTPIPALDPRIGRALSYSCSVDPPLHFETIFFGTESLLASWNEVGRHLLTLSLDGPRGTAVEIVQETTSGDHVVTVSGLPPEVHLAEGRVKCSFEIYIDPLDAHFHSSFSLLASVGTLDYEMYWPATDDIRAVRERARIAAGKELSRGPR